MVFNTKFKWGIYDGLNTLGIHNQMHYGQNQEKSCLIFVVIQFWFLLGKLHVSLKKPTWKRKLYLSLPLLSSQGRQKLRGVDFINQITSFLQHGHDQLPLPSQLA